MRYLYTSKVVDYILEEDTKNERVIYKTILVYYLGDISDQWLNFASMNSNGITKVHGMKSGFAASVLL